MKKVAVCLEHRFYIYKGNLYTKLSFPYFYWKDYLTYFNKVTIIARAQSIETLEVGMQQVNGFNIEFEPLPYYIGLKQFFWKFPLLFIALFKISLKYKYFLLRSGNSSNILFFFLMLMGKPYLREYPGNIKEGVIGFAGNSLKIRILANILDSLAKFQAKFSKANSFVSNYCLDLYASKKPSFVFSSFKASEIKTEVKKDSYLLKDKLNIVSVGRLEGEKGHLGFLEALKDVPYVSLHIVGDGTQKLFLENYAATHNIDIVFYGSITDRERLFSILKKADVFIIPSLTEGMPRALLEAMAVGLPCLGTCVGGIPEVLDSDSLYAPDDLELLKNKLLEIYKSQALREKMGLRNREFINRFYSDEALESRKHQFWSKLYE